MQVSRLNEIFDSRLREQRTGPAIEFERRWYSWDWVQQLSARLEALIVENGVPVETPIAIAARNRPPFAAALISLIARGRSVSTIYAFQSSAGLVRDILALKPAVFIADRQDWSDDVLTAARSVGTAAIALSLHDTGPDCVELLMPRRQDMSDAQLGAFPEPSMELLTSGTTGLPKRMRMGFDMLSHAMLRGNFTASAETDPALRPVGLIYPPFGNIAGIYSLMPLVAAGQSFVLLEKFSIDGWLAAVRTHRPAFMGIPPAGIRMILDANVPHDDLKSLDFVFSGAAPLDPSAQEAFETHYGIKVLLSYGATEFGGAVTNMTLDMRNEAGDLKRSSVGKPFGGADIRIVDVRGAALPACEEGIIEVKTPRAGNVWVRTSDLGMLDQDGFLFFRGRADGAIIRGGFKVMPEMVVEAIEKHPGVAAAAVVGVTDRLLGAVPAAAVELKPGVLLSESEIRDHAKGQLYAMQVPHIIRLVPALPRNPSFKIDMVAVAKLFAAKNETRDEA